MDETAISGVGFAGGEIDFSGEHLLTEESRKFATPESNAPADGPSTSDPPSLHVATEGSTCVDAVDAKGSAPKGAVDVATPTWEGDQGHEGQNGATLASEDTDLSGEAGGEPGEDKEGEEGGEGGEDPGRTRQPHYWGQALQHLDR